MASTSPTPVSRPSANPYVHRVLDPLRPRLLLEVEHLGSITQAAAA